MTAVLILAAGTGSRLMPITQKIPKPFLPFQDTTIFGRIFHQVKTKLPDCKIYSNLFHLPQVALQILEKDSLLDKVNIKVEDRLKGTAGSVLTFRKEFLSEGEIIIISGDIVFDFSLEEMLESHRKSRARITVATTKVFDGDRFGVFIRNECGTIVDFIEKPSFAKGKIYDVSAGIYIIDSLLISEIPSSEVWDFGSDWIPRLIKNESINLYNIDGFWADLGDIDIYHKLVLEYSTIGTHNYSNISLEGKNYIGQGATIGDGVYLRDCVVLPTAKIDDNTCLANAVIG